MKILQNIKAVLFGKCPNCGGIGTIRTKNDTGLLLDFNYSWVECRECGYIESTCQYSTSEIKKWQNLI